MRLNLEQLNVELLRRERASVDFMADTSRVQAVHGELVQTTGTHLVELDTSGPGEANAVGLRLPDDVGVFPLTAHGRIQVSQKLGIPKVYVDRMVAEGRWDLLERNFAEWLPDKERALFRVQDGQIRAMLSSRYRPMDNRPVLLAALHFLQGKGVEIRECHLTEERMYVKAHVPHLRQDIVKGDEVIPGLVISNSEVGSGSLRVEPFLYRVVCRNGMIGQDALTRVHLGGDLKGIEGLLQEDTIQAHQEATTKIVRDVIEGVFTPAKLDAWITEIRTGTRVEVAKPTEAVTWAVKNFGIPKALEASILDEFIRGDAGPTQWGLANAVTAVARDQENAHTQVDLERTGGEIATIDLSKTRVELAAEA